MCFQHTLSFSRPNNLQLLCFSLLNSNRRCGWRSNRLYDAFKFQHPFAALIIGLGVETEAIALVDVDGSSSNNLLDMLLVTGLGVEAQVMA
jgi:hypothetical protein